MTTWYACPLPLLTQRLTSCKVWKLLCFRDFPFMALHTFGENQQEDKKGVGGSQIGSWREYYVQIVGTFSLYILFLRDCYNMALSQMYAGTIAQKNTQRESLLQITYTPRYTRSPPLALKTGLFLLSVSPFASPPPHFVLKMICLTGNPPVWENVLEASPRRAPGRWSVQVRVTGDCSGKLF